MATSSLSVTARKLPVTASVSATPRRSPAWRSARPSRGQIEVRDTDDLARELTIQEGAVPSALAPMLPVLFVPNGRLLGALQSLISGVYKGPFAGFRPSLPSSTTMPAALCAGRRQALLSWPGAKDRRFTRVSTRRCRARECGGRQLREEPAGRHRDGPSAGDGASARRRGDGADRTSGVVDHKCRVFDGALMLAIRPCTRGFM